MEEYLVSSLEDCYKRNVYTSEDAVDYLATKLWTKKFESRRERILKDEVLDKLKNILLAHIKVTP